MASWRRVVAALALGLGGSTNAAPPPAEATRPAFVLPPGLRGQTVLFFGAHPDDEWGVAPILAEACLERGARCRFVVAGDAKSLGCLFSIGLKDVDECSRRRRAEMTASAALFGGTVEFLGREDLFYAFNAAGADRVYREWGASAGGEAALVRRVERILLRHRPRLVFTLDPRHGSSCHAAHLAAARLLIAAVRRLPKRRRPPVWLEQTDDIQDGPPDTDAIIRAGGFSGWAATAAQTRWYDANRPLRGGTAYDYTRRVRLTHATQFTEEAAGKKQLDPPLAARFVPVAPLDAAVAGDFCTALKLDRPTLDVPENRARLEKMLKGDK